MIEPWILGSIQGIVIAISNDGFEQSFRDSSPYFFSEHKLKTPA